MLQFGCCSWRFFLILLRHCESFPAYDYCRTKTAGSSLNSIIILQLILLSVQSIVIHCFYTFSTFSDVCRIWLPSPGSALGDWTVSVHWPAHSGLIWYSAEWRHSVLVPPVSTPCSLDTSSPPAGPGECPSPQSYITVACHPSAPCYLCRQLHRSGPEIVHHFAS